MRSYQKSKGTREKKENRRTSKQSINTPSKNQRENLPKTAKKKFPKTTSAEKLQDKSSNYNNIKLQVVDFKAKIPHKNKLKVNNNNINNNSMDIIEHNNKKNINKVNDKNNDDYHCNNDKKKSRNNINAPDTQKSMDDNSNKLNINTVNILNDYNKDKPEDPLKTGSAKKSNLIYTRFIDNLKERIDKCEHNESYYSKKKKDLFSNFLNKFVNVNEPAPSNNISKNIFNKLKSTDNNNKSTQLHVFNDISTNNVINLFFKGSSDNEIKIKNIENQYKCEIKKLEKELEIRDNKINEMIKAIEMNNNALIKEKEMEMKDLKINELLKVIEEQKKEIEKIDYRYRESFIENKKLENEYKEKILEKENIYNEIMNKYKELMLVHKQLTNREKEIILENQKLKEEIKNLNEIKKTEMENNINIKKNELNSNIEKNNSPGKEKSQPQYNNLITYNINKNNNYNIINGEINNFNNYLKNNNINNNNIEKETKVENERISLRDKDVQKETEQEKNERKERKASQAFERFKRMNKQNSINKYGEAQKSDKISHMAKMLEKQMGGMDLKNKERNNSVDIVKNEGGFNNHIVDLIDNKPVVSKKKKKIRSFSCDD
jgi:hypothetical protein